MENWIIYALIGLVVGAIIIFIWEELERSGFFDSEDSIQNQVARQRKEILQQLAQLEPHSIAYKQEAIVKCYEFATSKNRFQVNDVEQVTKELQHHYKTYVENKSTYKINFPEQSNLKLQPKEVLHIMTIINEGLHNASIHAKANFIFSILSIENRILNVITHDNGVGYDRKNTPQGNGIKTIQHAVKELNGDLKLTSTLGNGTVVNVEIPL